MIRFLATAAIALTLCAPVAAHACDITADPVSQDEVEAAGLGPLLRQADEQLKEDTDALMEPFTSAEEAKHPKTKQELAAAVVALEQVQDAYHNRMVILAKRARCGAAD
jgi:hypothetical protein